MSEEDQETNPVGELPITVAEQVLLEPIITGFGEQETETEVVAVVVVDIVDVVEFTTVEVVDNEVFVIVV